MLSLHIRITWNTDIDTAILLFHIFTHYSCNQCNISLYEYLGYISLYYWAIPNGLLAPKHFYYSFYLCKINPRLPLIANISTTVLGLPSRSLLSDLSKLIIQKFDRRCFYTCKSCRARFQFSSLYRRHLIDKTYS